MVAATARTDLKSSSEGIVSSAGSSAFGQGSNLAVNAMIVTNLVLADAAVVVTQSRLQTGGDLTVRADNDAGIDATLNSITRAGESATGVSLAFNTLGWASQNILFLALDALLGTGIGDERTSGARAHVTDSVLRSGGDLTVEAINAAALNATLSNAARSSASALHGASGAGASAVLASNMVSADAVARVDYTPTYQRPAGLAHDIDAGGDLVIRATDAAGVFANIKLTASSVTSNTAGVSVLNNSLAQPDTTGFKFESSDGAQVLKFGDIVRLAQNHAAGGAPGGLYRYMGPDRQVNLSTQNYENDGYWERKVLGSAIPEVNISNSEAMAVGMLVVRNDVRSGADAQLSDAKARAGALTVSALEKSTLRAVNDSEAVAEGGDGLIGSGSVLAINGVVASNIVQTRASAQAARSTLLTTEGDIVVSADNRSFIDARNLSNVISGDEGVSATLAFNSIGWAAQNILFQTIDALIGTDIGDENPARVEAYITDSEVSSARDVRVTANNSAVLRALVSNETESSDQAVTGASSLAVGAVVTGNMVSASTDAAIRTSEGMASPGQAQALGDVVVDAREQASIRADVKLSAISTSASDGGLSLVTGFMSKRLGGLDYTDRSGVRTLSMGDQVRVASATLGSNDTVGTLSTGQRVTVEFDGLGAVEGDVFEYIGAETRKAVDLAAEDWSDASRWRKVQGSGGQIYAFQGTAGTFDLALENFTDRARWKALKDFDPKDYIPGLATSISDSDSTAFGGLIARNDVRAGVDAVIHGVDVTAGGDVQVNAEEAAAIQARINSTVKSGGGSAFGKGSDLAVNAVIATNTVLATATADLLDGDIAANGDVLVTATDSALIQATSRSTVQSGKTGVGVVLAFNTVGWMPQNIFANAVDTLAGGVFGEEQAVLTRARTEDVNVTAHGDVTVEAVSTTEIDARILNSSVVIGLTPLGPSDTVSVGAVLTVNRVSSQTLALLGHRGLVIGGDVTVGATEAASIQSKVRAASIAVGVGAQGGKGISAGFAMSRNSVRSETEARLVGAVAGTAATVAGDVSVTVDRVGDINANVKATAVAVAAGLKGSMAVAGGGAIAVNNLLGGTQAQILDTDLSVGGDVDVLATDAATIDALVRAAALAVGVGTQSTPAVALGLSVAMNEIGWDRTAGPTVRYDNTQKVNTLAVGDVVRITQGPLLGQTYEYVGEDRSAQDGISLAAQNYYDRSQWRRVAIQADRAVTSSLVQGSSVNAAGNVTVEAVSTARIDAIVLAATAGIAASGQTGTAVSAAGVYTENNILMDVKAGVRDADLLAADTITVRADNAAAIDAIAGAASLGAALSGNTSAAVTIALSLAFNEIGGDTDARIDGVDRIEARAGHLRVTSTTRAVPLFEIDLSRSNLSASRLDDAANRASDAENTSTVNEHDVDRADDQQVLAALAQALSAQGMQLPQVATLNADWTYTSSDGTRTLKAGEKVRLQAGYAAGGTGDRVYEYIGTAALQDQDLARLNYADATRFRLATPEVRLQALDKGRSWQLVLADGRTYVMRLSDADPTRLEVSRSTINAISAAATLGLAIGGSTGLAVSGAGALAFNQIRSNTVAELAYGDAVAAGDVTVTAANTASIVSTVAAASLAVGAGSTGLGASIGFAVARNWIGYDSDSDTARTVTRATVRDAGVNALGDVDVRSMAEQRISALVLSGSAALAGGSTGIAASGSGVGAYNRIQMDITAEIDGDQSLGISADHVTVQATDGSTVTVLAGAASLAASVGATGVSLSIGAAVARNHVDNQVVAAVRNVQKEVRARVSDIEVIALEQASISVAAVAASAAAAFGATGVAVSGAGASANNTILGETSALVQDSRVLAAGEVTIEALNEATISSAILGLSLAQAGGATGVGASIGVGIARNHIGSDPSEAGAAVYDSSRDDPGTVRKGQTVYLAAGSGGARAGDTYRYIGAKDLARQDEQNLLLTGDYSDRTLWEPVVTARPLKVQAIAEGSDLLAGGDVLIHAESRQTIRADILVASAAVSAGATAVSLSGAGVTTENNVDVIIQSLARSSATGGDSAIESLGDVTLVATDRSTIDANASAVSLAAAIGIGGAAAIGVSLADNRIDQQIAVGLDGASVLGAGDMVVSATGQAVIDSMSQAVAASAGLVGLAGGGARASAVIDSAISAQLADADIALQGDLHIDASGLMDGTAVVEATAASLGLIAAAASGTVTDIVLRPVVTAGIDASTVTAREVDIQALGRQDAKVDTQSISVSTGVSVGVSKAAVDDRARVQAGLGDGVTLTADVLRVNADSLDLVDVRSVAATGGMLVGLSGGYSGMDIDSDAAVVVGDDNRLDVKALTLTAVHDQQADSQSLNLAAGLRAGSGAMVANRVTGRSDVTVGSDNRITADSVTMLARNRVEKDRYASEDNLRSGSAGLLNVSALASQTDFGTAADPLAARVYVGDGTVIDVNDSGPQPGVLKMESLVDIVATDNVRIEGVSGLGLSVGESRLSTRTDSGVVIDDAELVNPSGDITLASKTDTRVGTGSTLFSAALLSGGGSIATSVVDARNTISLDGAALRGQNVNLYAGRDAFAVPNLLSGDASANMTLVGLAGMGVPAPTTTIAERNTVSLLGDASVRALRDVNLVAKEGLSMPSTDGLVLSLSFVPYGVVVPEGGVTQSTNLVTVAPSSRVEAGIQNQLLMHVLPLTVNGEPQLAPERLGTALTAGEKATLQLDADQDYVYEALRANDIAVNVFSGTVVKVAVEPADGGPAARAGEIGAYYLFDPATSAETDLMLEQQDYTDTELWTRIEVRAATGTVAAQPGVTFVEKGGEVYRYVGGAATLDLATQDYKGTAWAEVLVYSSDVGSAFRRNLDGKFYVIKPRELEAPRLVYANVGNKLIERRETLLGWIASHAGNAEAVARYQAEVEQVEQTLKDMGLAQTLGTEGGALVAPKKLDVFVLDLPDLYASPGSVYIETGSAGKAALQDIVDSQITARSGATVNVLNTSPFGLQVNDVGVSAGGKTTVVDGKLVTLSPGKVYFNSAQISKDPASDAGSLIQIVQDGYPSAAYDLTIPPLPQDLYVRGKVVNEGGRLVLKNLDGSVTVTGELRAGTVDVAAKGNFDLSSDAWYHSSRDPRQYVDYKTLFSSKVFNTQGQARSLVFGSFEPAAGQTQNPGLAALKAAIQAPGSRVLSLGDINIRAQYLNINGLVQSGVVEYTLVVDENFNPGRSTGFTDALGNTLAGISYGAGNVPVTGFFDAANGTILLDPISAQGGRITLTGQVVSTGNGELRAASGYASVDIRNRSKWKLAADLIDVSTNRIGTITINDSASLSRTVYTSTNAAAQVQTFQGVLVPPSGDNDIASIRYELTSTKTPQAGQALTYQPDDGQYYVWVEGQEKTSTKIEKFEKNSFEVIPGFFDLDSVIRDDNKVRENVEFRDATPLLESEGLARGIKLPATSPLGQPQLANDFVYLTLYEQKVDESVDVVARVTKVYDVATLKVYTYVGSQSQVVFRTANFGDTSQWKYETTLSSSSAQSWADVKQQRYASNYVNSTRTVDSWTTGGGWFSKKTVHIQTVTVTGLKDYYTHALKADYPIAVGFIDGPQAPEIRIDSVGGLVLTNSVKLGGDPDALGAVMPPDDPFVRVPRPGSVSIAADALEIGDNAIIFGAAPTIDTKSAVALKLQDVTGSANVRSTGDVSITMLDGGDGQVLKLGKVLASGALTISAPNGIDGTQARIEAARIEMDGGKGAIDVRLDSAVLGTGGVAARATGDIRIVELAGDLRLIAPQALAGATASVTSLTGDVHLETVDGSVVNADHAGQRRDNTGAQLDARLQRLVDQGLVTAEQVRYTLSPALMAYLYPHAPMPGEAPVAPQAGLNIRAVDVTVVAGGTGSDIGRASGLVTIADPGRFDRLGDVDKALLSQARPSDVQEVRYAVYRYVGPDRTVYLGEQAIYENASLWARVTLPLVGSLDVAASSDDGVVDLRTGNLVASKFEIESVSLQVWEDVRIAARGVVDMQSDGDLVVEAEGDVRLGQLRGSDRLRVQATGSILGEAGSALHLQAEDITLRAQGVAGSSENAPLRLSLGDGRIQATAGENLSLALQQGRARLGILRAGETLTLFTRDAERGSIVDARNPLEAEVPNLDAKALVLEAQGSIGGFNDAALLTRADTLQARSVGPASLRHVIAIDNLGDLTVSGKGLYTANVDATVAVRASGTLRVDAPVLLDGRGVSPRELRLEAGADLGIAAPQAAADLRLDDTVTAYGATVTLRASGGIVQDASATIDNTAGSVELEAVSGGIEQRGARSSPPVPVRQATCAWPQIATSCSHAWWLAPATWPCAVPTATSSPRCRRRWPSRGPGSRWWRTRGRSGRSAATARPCRCRSRGWPHRPRATSRCAPPQRCASMR